MWWPICGDPTRMTTTYYCADDYDCERRLGLKARWRKRVDSGDVCEDKVIACPC